MKKVGLLLLSAFILFVLWMNLTSRYFQWDCVGVSYQKQGYHCQILPKPSSNPMNDVLVFLSNFDLNK
ncbi:hypothetical protein A2595_01820 [Candidatus Woesebacteria bacterium RIFOXYD1_FULL_31_53]|nr:MAG: hypothetical protein A2185_02230 [Candidatus Woesebacteria bacterium RIFOXYA1_FULL_31_71]OGM86243.1 MAG: hypothetical protein A2595_01820 [Candidatus Woesebacteria bacterium RIFOXYD1_FULL_31_53]